MTDVPLAVATRTVIHRRRRVQFMWGSLRAALQARRTPGYLGGALRVDRGPVFWTLTLWRDGSSMNAFRNSAAHGDLMPRMANWASQASTTAWKTEAEPSWDEAFERMAERAHWIELQRPDQWHQGSGLQRPSAGGVTVPVPRRRSTNPSTKELAE